MPDDAGSSKSHRPTPPAAAPAAADGGKSATVFIDWGPSLPEAYGKPRILALVRDPRAFFACWEGGDTIRARDLGDGALQEHAVERIGSWYFEGLPEHEYQVELISNGRTVASSNRIRLPRLDPATAVDPEWTPTPEQEEVLRKLAAASEPDSVGGEAPGASKTWRLRIAGMPVSRPSRTS